MHTSTWFLSKILKQDSQHRVIVIDKSWVIDTPLGGAFLLSPVLHLGECLLFFVLPFFSFSPLDLSLRLLESLNWQAFMVPLSESTALWKSVKNELMIFLLLCHFYNIWTGSPASRPGFPSWIHVQSLGNFFVMLGPNHLRLMESRHQFYLKISSVGICNPGWELCLVGALYKFYLLEWVIHTWSNSLNQNNENSSM